MVNDYNLYVSHSIVFVRAQNKKQKNKKNIGGVSVGIWEHINPGPARLRNILFHELKS